MAAQHPTPAEALTFLGGVIASLLLLVGAIVTATFNWRGKQREASVDEEALLVQREAALNSRFDAWVQKLETQYAKLEARVEILETQLAEAQSKLAQAEREIATLTLERDTALEDRAKDAARMLELEVERARLRAEVARLTGLLASGDAANEP